MDFKAIVRLPALSRAALACLGLVAAAALAFGQPAPPTPYAPPPESGAPPPAFAPAQLDQMLAPVALYPDGLLGQVLMACAYPLEIVQADRWLQSPENAGLSGDSLVQALEPYPWDNSVKSLAAFPQVLKMLDDNLDWTERLGEAFISQQADVMESVQRLRTLARGAGYLDSTPQQTVDASGGAISIAPADPGIVYVPVYSPGTSYGPWPYADYPPDEVGFADFAFGTFVAFAIVAPFWGWDTWDWHHHHLNVGPPRRGPDRRPPPGGTSRIPERHPWKFAPEHRGGVPYHDPAVQARVGGGSAARTPYRGFEPQQGNSPRENFPRQNPPAAGFQGGAPHGAASAPLDRTPVLPSPPIRVPAAPALPPPPIRVPATPALPPPPNHGTAPSFSPPAAREPTRTFNPPAVHEPAKTFNPRPAPPAMESFGRGPQVEVHEQRGAQSRGAEPAAPAGPRGRPR
jgi:hypothetical protein